MRPFIVFFLVISCRVFSQTNAIGSNWRTVQKDTVIIGTLVDICHTVGKKSDIPRLADYLIVKTGPSDSVYVARPVTFNVNTGKIGEKVTYPVTPWLNNYLFTKCRLNKNNLIVTIQK